MTIQDIKSYQDKISDFILVLIYLGKLGGLKRPIFSTTREIGEAIGISQQSASRKLTQMEDLNLIVRTYKRRGNAIKVTQEGMLLLEQVFIDLWMIFTSEGKKIQELKISIRGKVTTGMGEGAYYMSKQGYQNQFAAILGFIPYPGTLNLQLLEEPNISNFELLLRSPAKYISEFKENSRIYGKVFVWPAFIVIRNQKIPAAIIRPDRTHHDKQIEVISEKHIKSEFNINDGDEIEVIFG